MNRLGAPWQRHGDRWALGAAALALVLTYFAPTLPVPRSRVHHVVVLDITQSMNVPDQRLHGEPATRLAYAKHALRESLLALPCGSKVGWGLFTEYRSFLLFAPVEVCANLAELRSTLAGIDGRMAWTGNSEVAKGVHSGIAIAAQLPGTPSLVFVTDGHEAPPLNPRHRPRFDGKPGEVSGLIVGVGELTPSPIPKSDPAGRPLGHWGADEVLQTDPRSRGRGGSVDGERMVEDEAVPGAWATLPGVVPGSEHLSALRDAYLRLLASETGLAYLRLQDGAGLLQALTAPGLSHEVAGHADLRPALALLALLALLGRLVPDLRRRWRR